MAAENVEIFSLPSEISTNIEGIAIHPIDGMIYVSEVTSGRISRIDPENETSEVFLDTSPIRTEAVGLSFDSTGKQLWIAGGSTATAFVYDIATKALIASATSSEISFLNDVVVNENGIAFFSDSRSGNLFEATLANQSISFRSLLTSKQASIIDSKSRNASLNGVAVSGSDILSVHTRSGRLYKIDATGSFIEMPVVDAGVVGRDGISVENGIIYGVDLAYFNPDGKAGVIVSAYDSMTRSFRVKARVEDDSFDTPTTLAIHNGRICAANSQFGQSSPTLPFTVSCFDLPDIN